MKTLCCAVMPNVCDLNLLTGIGAPIVSFSFFALGRGWLGAAVLAAWLSRTVETALGPAGWLLPPGAAMGLVADVVALRVRVTCEHRSLSAYRPGLVQ